MSSVVALHPNLRSAFRERLIATPGLSVAFAWEGRQFTPTVGQPFLRESFRPVYSSVRALGTGGTIAHRMTGNLSLFFPAGRGTKAVEDAAGLILARFAPGTSLTYGGSSGYVEQAERAPLVQEPDWLSCPITITVTAYSVN